MSCSVAPPHCAAILAANPAAMDGEYLMSPDGATTVTTYCDMTRGAGGWTQIYDQDWAEFGRRHVTTEWNAVNTSTPNMGDYAILGMLPNLGSAAGYEFVYEWLDGPMAEGYLQWTQDQSPLVMGDSAGGNLAAVSCLMARDRGGVRPLGQVMLYPVISPDFETDSYRRYATGHFNTREAMRWYWRHYMGGDDLPQPAEYAAPLRAASLAGLPPAIVVTAGRDPLCSEGALYAAALRDAGVPVRHRHYPELFHGFATIAGFAPATQAQIVMWRDIDAFLRPAEAKTLT